MIAAVRMYVVSDYYVDTVIEKLILRQPSPRLAMQCPPENPVVSEFTELRSTSVKFTETG